MPYFKDAANKPHYLSAVDIANGGEKYLPAGCVSITDAEAAAILDPTAAQLHADFVSTAKNALDASDMVAIRCMKAGVVFPSDWQVYVASMRSIVNGSDTTSTTLPTKPAYPGGT